MVRIMKRSDSSKRIAKVKPKRIGWNSKGDGELRNPIPNTEGLQTMRAEDTTPGVTRVMIAGFRLDPDVVEAIAIETERQGISRPVLMRRIIGAWYQEWRKQCSRES